MPLALGFNHLGSPTLSTEIDNIIKVNFLSRFRQHRRLLLTLIDLCVSTRSEGGKRKKSNQLI